VPAVERELTLRHADAVRRLLRSAGLGAGDVRLCGFHGHTILHEPRAGRTWQIGDGALLAAETGIDVVADFRSADMAAGGEGAPLAPLSMPGWPATWGARSPCSMSAAFANVTWIGPPASGGETPALLAFDTGPGNALSDDWAQAPYRPADRRRMARWRGPGGRRAGAGRPARTMPISPGRRPNRSIATISPSRR